MAGVGIRSQPGQQGALWHRGCEVLALHHPCLEKLGSSPFRWLICPPPLPCAHIERKQGKPEPKGAQCRSRDGIARKGQAAPPKAPSGAAGGVARKDASCGDKKGGKSGGKQTPTPKGNPRNSNRGNGEYGRRPARGLTCLHGDWIHFCPPPPLPDGASLSSGFWTWSLWGLVARVFARLRWPPTWGWGGGVSFKKMGSEQQQSAFCVQGPLLHFGGSPRKPTLPSVFLKPPVSVFCVTEPCLWARMTRTRMCLFSQGGSLTALLPVTSSLPPVHCGLVQVNSHVCCVGACCTGACCTGACCVGPSLHGSLSSNLLGCEARLTTGTAAHLPVQMRTHDADV